MKIKRIEICGFKSFCGKTTIAFPDPITAIVGPNGCGKSNVVDAIRWVMGEQSAKHLRGRAMEDVIFAGSETRGPMGLAEVSLTFDAAAMPGDAAPGGVPWGAVKPEEVVVTRRLYRGGESEYLLNGVPSRLRDVVEFFLGTGVGSKAYAIIEQGRIGFIVSSRAEERRGLIDEAAGITKYKVKKRAAERRMEATRQHLLRVSDVVTEIETRLRSLRLQAQKAERYRRYKAEARDLDLWASSQKYLGLLVEEKSLVLEAEALRERVLRDEGALAVEETAVEAERLAAADDVAELGAAKDELYALENKAQLGLQRAQHYDDEAAALAARVREARGELSGLERRRTEHAGAIADIEAKIASFEAASSASRRALEEKKAAVEAVKGELAAARAAIEADAIEIGRLRTRIARSEGDLEAATTRREDLAARQAAAQAEASSVRQGLTALAAETEGLESAVRGLSDSRTALASRREEAAGKLTALRDEAERGELELETLREEAHRRRSRLASLREIQERYESFQRGVRAIMQEHRERAGSGVMGVVADIVQPPPELETAVEAVLGERLGNIIVESHDVGVEAIEFLKSKSEGRSSFIPMGLRAVPGAGQVVYDAMGGASVEPSPPAFVPWPTGEGVRGPMLELIGYDRRYDKVAAHLLGDVLVVDDLRRAIELWRQTHTNKTIVTLDGEVLDPQGVVTGGSRESAVAGVLGQKREIRELEEVVARLEVDYEAALARHVGTKRALGEVTGLLEEIGVAARDGEVGLIGKQKDLERVTAEIARLDARRVELAGETGRLATDRTETEAKIAALRESLRTDVAAVDVMERRLDGSRAKAAAFEADLEEQAARLTGLEVAAAQAGDRHRTVEENLLRLRRERLEDEERGQRLAQITMEDEARAETLRVDATRLRDEALLAKAEAEERARAQGERQAAVEARGAVLARREADLRAARAGAAQARQDLSRLELRTQEATLRRTSLEEQVRDRYRDVELPAVVFDHHMRPAFGEAEEARQNELRGLIERMGEINLTAISESEELQKRFDFLTTQRADLDLAIAQLETAIEKINRASRKRFRETFEAVNAKFEEVFPRLFNGGRAQLSLTDPNDLLETGVDIVANPPGKKVMQNIELLSGGEKALTAVSLLFAIFLVKPSPFCLLDEVDAPLDEANVGRFNDVVREMTDRSQFIIITHNRRTMEIADRLCGITMEEAGVSKLVAVNLRSGRLGRVDLGEGPPALDGAPPSD